MPDTSPAGPQPSVATLVGGLIEDTQRLIRQEVALARRELQEEWTKTKEGGLLLAAAGVVFGLVGVLLAFTLVELLHQYVLPGSLWICFLIITVLFALGGVGLLSAAQARLEQVHVVPPQTADSLRRDVRAMTAAGSPLARQR